MVGTFLFVTVTWNPTGISWMRTGLSTQGGIIPCPNGLSKDPLDIQVGQKSAYNHLILELIYLICKYKEVFAWF